MTTTTGPLTKKSGFQSEVFMTAAVAILTFFWAAFTLNDYQDSAQQLLRTVRSLRCEFPTGTIVNLATDPPAREDAPGPSVVYDAIDRKNKRARLIGTIGTEDMTVLVGNNTLSLIEITPTGTPIITVVYGQYRTGTRELLAVTSRHFGHLGPRESVITLGQYYGSCRQFE